MKHAMVAREIRTRRMAAPGKRRLVRVPGCAESSCGRRRAESLPRAAAGFPLTQAGALVWAAHSCGLGALTKAASAQKNLARSEPSPLRKIWISRPARAQRRAWNVDQSCGVGAKLLLLPNEKRDGRNEQRATSNAAT